MHLEQHPEEHRAWQEVSDGVLSRAAATTVTALRVGGTDIVALSDGEFRMAPDFIDDPAAHASVAGPDGRVSLPVGAFLIPGDETVLVDAGAGPLHFAQITGGNLLTQLRAQGVAPDDVATVALTHLHSDHSGWLARPDGTPVFRHARILIRRAEWDHFLGDGPGRMYFAHVAHALRECWDAGRVELVDGECAVTPHLTALPAPGHTPGHTVYAIHDSGERAMILGDAVHCPLQLTAPDWAALADVDPVQARRTRAQLVRELDRTGQPGVGCHFPGLVAARLVGGATLTAPR